MKKIHTIDNHHLYYSYWEERDNQYKQSLIFPKSTYSPWLEDEDFIIIYDKIKENTLVDIYRCYELWSIGKSLKKKKGDILEVGVWRGGTGSLLCKADGGTNKIYLCDTFSGVPKAGLRDSKYSGGEHADTSKETVVQLMAGLNLTNYEILEGVFPEETGNIISRESFKICHIDVDVYQSAKDIFTWVWDKIIVGGVVIFDDYGFAACNGVTTLVNELSEKTRDSFFIHNINGHGLLIKTGL